MFPFEQYIKTPQSPALPTFDPPSSQKLDGFLDQLLSKENQTKCLYHSEENIEFFCLNSLCQRNLVCTDCLLEDIHEGHEVKKLDKLSDSWHEMLKTSEIKLKYYKESLELLLKKYENFSQTIAKGVEQKKADILKAFDLVFESLKKRQKCIFDYLDQLGLESESKNNEKVVKVSETIKMCSDGLEKISFSENFQKLSIIDLSNCFVKIKEIIHKIDLNEDMKKPTIENFTIGVIKANSDHWLGNLSMFLEKLIPNAFPINEKATGELNIENNSSKMKANIEEDGFDNFMKETMSIKDSYLNNNMASPNKNHNSSGIKKKYQEKYGQLLEVFKPELAKSKLTRQHDKGKDTIRSFYNQEFRTPEKKRISEETGNVEKRENDSKGFLYSLEKQQLKYVGSAQKLI